MNIGVSYIETSLYCEKLQLFILCENLEASSMHPATNARFLFCQNRYRKNYKIISFLKNVLENLNRMTNWQRKKNERKYQRSN